MLSGFGSSGNANHGTALGPILSPDRFGNADSAYMFDGVDDYIEVPNTNGVFNLTASWTLAAWVKPTGIGTDQRDDPILWKLARVQTNEDAFILGWGCESCGAENRFLVGLERASNGEDINIGSLTHSPNQWLHVV